MADYSAVKDHSLSVSLLFIITLLARVQSLPSANVFLRFSENRQYNHGFFWYIHSVKWFLEQMFAFNYDPKAIVLKNCESWLLEILGKQYLQMSEDSRQVFGTIANNCCIEKQNSTITKHTNCSSDFNALCYCFVFLHH